MASLEKIEIPITEFICVNCRSKDEPEVAELPSPYVILNVPLPAAGQEPVSVTVDVESIEWKKLDPEGLYIAQARVRIVCPCCESARSVMHHIGASRLVLVSADVCGSCGGELSLHDEEITYDGMAGSGPSVVIRGTLACATCTAEKMSVEAHVPVRGILDENSDVQVEIGFQGARVSPAKVESRRTRRLLVVVASPRDSDQLRLANECRIIEKCIERGKERDFLETKIIQAATIDDWARTLLEDEYNIIHFSGHGTGARPRARKGERPVV